MEHWKQLIDLQHDWDFQAVVKFNNLERCFWVQMQNKSLPWREFCELVGDTGIYSPQVSSFAGGYRYLYSSMYKIGKCPRSCLFPMKNWLCVRWGMNGYAKKSRNIYQCTEIFNTNTNAQQFKKLRSTTSHKGTVFLREKLWCQLLVMNTHRIFLGSRKPPDGKFSPHYYWYFLGNIISCKLKRRFGSQWDSYALKHW